MLTLPRDRGWSCVSQLLKLITPCSCLRGALQLLSPLKTFSFFTYTGSKLTSVRLKPACEGCMKYAIPTKSYPFVPYIINPKPLVLGGGGGPFSNKDCRAGTSDGF